MFGRIKLMPSHRFLINALSRHTKERKSEIAAHFIELGMAYLLTIDSTDSEKNALLPELLRSSPVFDKLKQELNQCWERANTQAENKLP